MADITAETRRIGVLYKVNASGIVRCTTALDRKLGKHSTKTVICQYGQVDVSRDPIIDAVLHMQYIYYRLK
jgi:hypothetical protein